MPRTPPGRHMNTNAISPIRRFLVGALVVLGLACSGGRDQGGGLDSGASSGSGSGSGSAGDGDSTDGDGDGDPGGDGDGPPRLDVGGGAETDGNPDGGEPGECENVKPPPPNATLTGTVFAPNLEIPISGALVYTIGTRPEGIPDAVYCSECQGVPCDRHYVFTEADGSFELPAVAASGQWFVVIKGEFMHMTQMDIVEGTTAIEPVVSSLPGEWNPDEGHYIPKMAVMRTQNDEIFNVLAKLGLGQVDANGVLVEGTEQFDIFGDGNNNPEGNMLLDDLNLMSAYHLIFVPCMSQGPLSTSGGDQIAPARAENIRQWVEAGGKWYVTDFANEYLYNVFPPYQTFHENPNAFFGGPDLDAYNTDGTVLDPDLLAWLEALPAPLRDIGGGAPTLNTLPTVRLEDNWSGLEETPPVIVQDDEGNDVDVGHYAWVEGPCGSCVDTARIRPMTISARYGCGRMLFSTYHTNEHSHLGLTPQELILLYIILEIGVCQEGGVTVPPIG